MLKSSCPDTNYAATITETIKFLLLIQRLPLAQELFHSYRNMCESIERFQSERIKTTKLERIEAEKLTRSHGDQHELNHLLIALPIEKVVDELTCAQLDTSLIDFFEYLRND